MRHNFNLAKELAEQSEKDWKFGALSQPGIVNIPLEERLLWLPPGEIQNMGEEKNDCVTRGHDNVLEAQFQYGYEKGLFIPENMQFLKQYVNKQTGRIEFSDRFNAILSGTTAEGNSLKAPIESIRTNGVIPKSMFPQVEKFDEYYDPAKVTQDMIDLGKEFKRRFTINYEQVATVHILDLLKNEMLVVAGYAWPDPVNDVYPRVEGPFNHCFLEVNPNIDAFDNYPDYDNVTRKKIEGDFVKRLATDYEVFEWGYRVFISSNQLPKKKFIDLALAWLVQVGLWLVKREGPPPQAPKEILPPKYTPPAMPNNLKIADTATSLLNTDASPQNLAPQELACAESVSNILHAVFPDFPANIVGTDALFAELKRSPHFKAVLDPQVGTIVVSPRIGDTPGHCGIYIGPDAIASNDSATGLFKENYTRASWRKTFIAGRKLKGYLFDAV